jgi:hypothetical protein
LLGFSISSSIFTKMRYVKTSQNFFFSSPVNLHSKLDIPRFSLNHRTILLYNLLHFILNLSTFKYLRKWLVSGNWYTVFTELPILALVMTWLKRSMCQCPQQLSPKCKGSHLASWTLGPRRGSNSCLDFNSAIFLQTFSR